MKNSIKLTERDFHRIIKESVNKVILEYQGDLNKDEWIRHRGIIESISDKIEEAKALLLKYMGDDDTKWETSGALGECLTHLTQAKNELSSLNMIRKNRNNP